MVQFLSKACGNLTGIPSKLPKLTSEVFLLIQVAVPVLLVIMGTIDLFKGITANKEDDMAKGRKLFVKRLITGALVFLLIMITKLLIGAIDDNNSVSIIACMDCFMNDKCQSNAEIEYKNQAEDRAKNLKEWQCILGGQTIGYHSEGNKFVISPVTRFNGKAISSTNSEFTPKVEGECPSMDNYALSHDKKNTTLEVITRKEADSITWSCTIGEYTFKYRYLSGTPTFAATQAQAQMPVIGSESEFVPQYVYQCPSSNDYNVVKEGAQNATIKLKVVKK